MQELLFLAHRVPYPPDKGDKIRSWNFLKHLAERYRVHLGCFIDDPRDWEFTEFLRGICHDCCFVKLEPHRARLRSLRGLLDGRPLTLPYYFDTALDRWVREVLSRSAVTKVFIFCSAMAQYVSHDTQGSPRRVADLVDIDSEKWFDYARTLRGPKAWLWRREGERLRDVEKDIACSFDTTVVATAAELKLLRSFVPAAASHIAHVGNGVDAGYFSPDRQYAIPQGMRGTALVFTGAMDYRPNIDAVLYFARAILPSVRQRIPDINFYVVGSNPKPEIVALSSDEGIIVTGRVPDVRPYLAHANVFVAPLRIARGVQNKVLEAMAMAKPVVASSAAINGIEAQPGNEILVADGAEAFTKAICRVVETDIGAQIGRDARRRVLADYAWSASLTRLDAALGA